MIMKTQLNTAVVEILIHGKIIFLDKFLMKKMLKVTYDILFTCLV